MIRDRLTKGEAKLDVIPIFGMGGIGKTTLAKTIYNDPVVSEYFDFQEWVYVSKWYSGSDLLLAILKNTIGITMEGMKDMGVDELGLELRKYLRSSRCLVVLDDVWKIDSLEEVSQVFTNNMNRSRIIITTCQKEVALHANSRFPPHNLHGLSEDASWELFSKKSFMEDQISKLADDIIVSILSRLKIEEQARTSLLACRWRYLWRFTRSLKFEVPNQLRRHQEDKLFHIRCMEFVGWVCHVLKLHRGETIDELSITFCLDDEKFKRDIDYWISFAFKKRVSKLKLNFSCGWTDGNWNYSLSAEILPNSRLDSLTSLIICDLIVTEEVLGYMLSAFPSLEELVILHCKSLVNLTVSGPSLKLKYLEIGWCNMESVNICDVNVVSFKYWEVRKCKTSISLKNTPCLVEAWFGGSYAGYMVKKSIQDTSCLPQLQTLTLDLSCNFEELSCFPKYPKLRNLRRLVLKLNCHVSGLQLCICLLRASPSLIRLRIEFWGLEDSTKELMKLRRRPKRPHNCLKVVELIGFVGCEADLGIASYLLSSTVSLGKIIIDPHRPDKKEFLEDHDKLQAARTCARRRLEKRLPLGAELVVL